MAKKRRTLSLRTRFDIFKRDRFTCQYCGRKPPEVILEVDHVDPVSKGGGCDELNLLTSCFECNRGKADGKLNTIPESRAKQVQDRIDIAAQTEALSAFLLEEREKADRIIEILSTYWCDKSAKPKDIGKFRMSDYRENSLRRFLKFLTSPEIQEAIDIAHSRFPTYANDMRTWKYFCGICWKLIKEGRDG